MKLDNDAKERIKIIFLFIFQSYKILMGCMLLLFVPQLCDEEVCTLTEKIENPDDRHQITLIVNGLSVLLFVILYGIELKRENWCVKYLDINHDFSDNYLTNVIKDKPELLLSLNKYNNYYFLYSIMLTVIYSINLILSSIVVYEHYAGLPSITSYLSFTGLIILKLYYALSISYSSKINEKALSSFMTEFSSYNVIDADYTLKDNIENNIEDKIENNIEDNIENNIEDNIEDKNEIDARP